MQTGFTSTQKMATCSVQKSSCVFEATPQSSSIRLVLLAHFCLYMEEVRKWATFFPLKSVSSLMCFVCLDHSLNRFALTSSATKRHKVRQIVMLLKHSHNLRNYCEWLVCWIELVVCVIDLCSFVPFSPLAHGVGNTKDWSTLGNLK